MMLTWTSPCLFHSRLMSDAAGLVLFGLSVGRQLVGVTRRTPSPP